MARNLCLFAHFDAHNRVEPYVLRYVKAIRSCGFDVVFISTAAISSADVEILNRVCCDVIRRPNRGLDFASWATGYARHGQHVAGEILLANDSVYGPIGDLAAALERLRAMPGDVRGMVESIQHERHIQSWFVLLSPDAYRSAAFRETLMQDFANLSKAEIVAKGEIGLSSRLYAAGFKGAALFSLAHRERDGAVVRYNPAHTIWKELIEIFAVPFIKVELLRDNPGSICNLSQWRDVVNARAPELVSMIEGHLSRAGRSGTGTDEAALREFLLARQAFERRDFWFDLADRRIAKKLNRYTFEIAAALVAGGRRIRAMTQSCSTTAPKRSL